MANVMISFLTKIIIRACSSIILIIHLIIQIFLDYSVNHDGISFIKTVHAVLCRSHKGKNFVRIPYRTNNWWQVRMAIFPCSAIPDGTTGTVDTAFLQSRQSRGIFASQLKGENACDHHLDLDYSRSSGYCPLLGGSWTFPRDDSNELSWILALQAVGLHGAAKE